MKRTIVPFLIAIVIVTLASVFLPASLAKRNESSVKHSNSKNGPIVPDLFKVNRQEEGSARRSRCGQWVSPSRSRFVIFLRSRRKSSQEKCASLSILRKDESAEGKYGVEEKNEKNREITRRTDPNAPRTPDQALSTKSSSRQRPCTKSAESADGKFRRSVHRRYHCCRPGFSAARIPMATLDLTTMFRRST